MGRGRLPSSEGEMSAKPTEGYGSVRPPNGGGRGEISYQKAFIYTVFNGFALLNLR